VPHQVLVSITQDVIAVGAVLTEIERLVFKDGDEVGETLLTMDQNVATFVLSPRRLLRGVLDHQDFVPHLAIDQLIHDPFAVRMPNPPGRMPCHDHGGGSVQSHTRKDTIVPSFVADLALPY